MELAASPMLELVTKKLGSVLKEQTLEVWQVDHKLRELQAAYLQIQALLGQLDRPQQQLNPTLEPWLLDLDGCCYDTEDLVDDLILSRGHDPLLLYIFKSGRLTLAHQIGDLQKKLIEIGSLIEKLLPSGAIDRTAPPPLVSRSLLSDQTPLAAGTSRDKDKRKIIEKLIGSDSCGVSIIGMDGLGKTALARSIINDRAINRHFPRVLSASVSGHFQMEHTIKELRLQHSACSSHRSLIVLDDLWSVNDEDWDFFMCNYLNSCCDWRILTTTRNPRVAEVTGTAPYYLNTMTEEDCKKDEVSTNEQQRPTFIKPVKESTVSQDELSEQESSSSIASHRKRVLSSKPQRETSTVKTSKYMNDPNENQKNRPPWRP